MIARVMSDRQPIALVGHDGLELGAGKGNLPVYHLTRKTRLQTNHASRLPCRNFMPKVFKRRWYVILCLIPCFG